MSDVVVGKDVKIDGRFGDKPVRLISEVNFQKLIDVKESVYQETDVSPSVSKVVNMVIDQADLEMIRQKLIERFS